VVELAVAHPVVAVMDLTPVEVVPKLALLATPEIQH